MPPDCGLCGALGQIPFSVPKIHFPSFVPLPSHIPLPLLLGPQKTGA